LANGKYLAYIRIPNTHNLLPFTPVPEANAWSIRLYDVAKNTATEIWKATPGKGSAFVDNISVAKKLLWWAGSALVFPYEKDGWVHLYSLNVENGTTRLLTPGNGEVENVTISPNGKTIYYTSNITDIERRHLWKVDVATGTQQILTKGKGIEWSPVVVENGVAFLHSSATKPPWPAVLQNEVITDLGAELFPKNFPQTLVQPKVIMIKATDGMQVPAQLFLPPNHNPTKKYPALLFLHGGSKRQMLPGFHYGQYYSNAYALNQYFAAQGYVVLSLNYRSGIGYGLAFREAANYGIAGASEVKDLIGAGLYLKSRTDVDATKIALWGASYGGYLTAH
ncbi:MAG: prolyl oligopeptidase family serine peptidase, partial [Bacteroidota bacterium]